MGVQPPGPLLIRRIKGLRHSIVQTIQAAVPATAAQCHWSQLVQAAVPGTATPTCVALYLCTQ